jgi:uncharacterized OB-fold protein
MRFENTTFMETETQQVIAMNCSSCGQDWDYTGSVRFPDFTSCPECNSTQRVPKVHNVG